jgi:phosphohistidine phosphatase
MKTLLLLRHAKSSWANDKLSDYERPLNDRGLADAPKMGKLLRREGLTPDAIISSSAVRAATTAELVAMAADFEGTIRYTEALYHAEPEAYRAAARAVPDEVNTLMLVGHNPGMEELLEILSGHAEAMPTAAVAHFRLPIDRWSDFSLSGQATLVALWRPKEIA